MNDVIGWREAGSYTFTLLNGLSIGGEKVKDTKHARILSALLTFPNEVVDGDSLVEAGWFDDVSAGRTSKIRGYRGAIESLLKSSGLAGDALKSSGAGAYSLTVEPTLVDLHDVQKRDQDARHLAREGETLEALRVIEPAIHLLLQPVHRVGAARPNGAGFWQERLEEVQALRASILERYVTAVLSKTNFDPERLLQLLTRIDLAAAPVEKLWQIRIGLTVELHGQQSASQTLTEAKIALTRLSVPNPLDSQTVSSIHAQIKAMLDRRSGNPAYEVPTFSASPKSVVDGTSSSPAVRSAARSDLAEERARLLGRRITGSSTLTMSDIHGNPSLRMPVSASIRSGPDRQTAVPDVLTHLVEELRASDRRYMVIAPPGAGKSLVCRLVFLALAASGQNSNSSIPGLIDLRSSTIADATALAESRDILLLDSLDELLGSGTLAQVHAAVQEKTLESARVITCRTQFYEQFLTATPLVEDRTIVEIHTWDIRTIEKYIDAYHQHVFSDSEQGVFDDLKRRLESPSIESLLSIPLRLNMALDLIPPGENNLPVDLNSLSLHRQWIQQTLRNEAARQGSYLDADDKLEHLTTLAWRFYDEGTPGSQHAPSFTEGEIRQVLTEVLFDASKEQVKQTARDLEFYSILISAEQERAGTTQFDSFEFQHKTFQEFLVARYVINAAKSGPEAAASVFRQYLSPQVSDFIKDELKNVSQLPGQAQRLATNLQQALASYDREASHDPDSIRLRSTIQQICYYLASIPLEPVRVAMLDRLARERDNWIARAISIGLSFGGEARGLDQYIEMLSREREIGSSFEANSLNVGYHLSFFGDQPFDPVQPYIDRGLDSVSATVSRLIYQLSIETDFGSWRLDLYTLIDLYHHREISRRSYISSVAENRDRFNWVIRNFQTDPRTRNWPEITKLCGIMEEIGAYDVEPG